MGAACWDFPMHSFGGLSRAEYAGAEQAYREEFERLIESEEGEGGEGAPRRSCGGKTW